MKKNLFISQKATLSRDVKSLKITLDEKEVKIPLGIIEHIFIIGSQINLTNSARNMLLEHNKSIFYYSSSYKMQGVLSNTKLQSNYRNRLLQYEAFNQKSLKIAKFIVSKKIESMMGVFKLPYLSKSIQKSFEIEKITELLGVEGYATTQMFKKFKTFLEIKNINDFTKREYHPTKDKVNGILSFTYTLYSNLLYGLVLSEGYDPYIGFLHKKRGTHHAFVSDIIEFDRADLTLFVLKLFTYEYLNNTHFEDIFLNKEGRKLFLEHFNNFSTEQMEKSKHNLYVIGEQLV